MILPVSVTVASFGSCGDKAVRRGMRPLTAAVFLAEPQTGRCSRDALADVFPHPSRVRATVHRRHSARCDSPRRPRSPIRTRHRLRQPIPAALVDEPRVECRCGRRTRGKRIRPCPPIEPIGRLRSYCFDSWYYHRPFPTGRPRGTCLVPTFSSSLNIRRNTERLLPRWREVQLFEADAHGFSCGTKPTAPYRTVYRGRV